MVTLELRYIPGLAFVMPVPSQEHCFSIISRAWKDASINFSERAASFHFDTLREAIDQCNILVKTLSSKGLSLNLPETFPFSVICSEDMDVPGEMWRLAPAGHLLIPAHADYPGAYPWLYDWTILPLEGDYSVHERISPINSLLTTGPYEQECFFCGSHHHNTLTCHNMWAAQQSRVSVSALSRINPSLWLEYLKKTGGTDFNIITSLDLLKQNMRQIFTWDFACRISRSTALEFKEFSSSPLKAIEICEHRAILEAASKRDIESIRININDTQNSQDRASLSILKGFYYVATGDEEKALSNWWDAEREAGTGLLKSYAAVLQARLYLMKKDKMRAEAAIKRAIKSDYSPLSAYWLMIISAIQGKKNPTLTQFNNIAPKIPELATSALCEPLLLRYCREIEDSFTDIWKRYEISADQQAKYVEKLIQLSMTTFDSSAIKDAAIKLRDWFGSREGMGFKKLVNSSRFLADLQKRVEREIKQQCKKTLSQLQKYKSNCHNILGKIPDKNSTSQIRQGCREIIAMVQNSSLSTSTINIDRFGDIREEIQSIIEKYRHVEAMYQNYIERMSQRRAAIKFLLYGTFFAITIWLAVYIYELLIMI